MTLKCVELNKGYETTIRELYGTIQIIFPGLDKTHVEPSSSELAAMITPPESKSLKFRGLDSSGTMTSFSDDFDFRDKSIDSDDSLWATVEDPANATNLESRRSSEFWKEVEKRMGCKFQW